MTRTLLALACSIAALAACGSAAQACISCEYTPEVLKAGESQGRGSYEARPSKRVREYTEKREERSSKKRVTKRESEPVKSKSSTASNERAKEKESTASREEPKKTVATASVASDAAENEHSAITTSGSSIANTVKAAITPPKTGPQNENSTISKAVASSDHPEDVKKVEQTATTDHGVGCKKYFPSTGLTLSVPCDPN